MILYDLGFPTDAIEVVKDLYTGATTTVHTPHGPIDPLEFNRGTIQGDSLSPFLFVVYLEPLLRWLRAGRQGYMVGALAEEGEDRQDQYQISDITYADDVNILTGGEDGLTNVKHQASKLSHYADWGDLIVNNTKTTVTGALHQTHPDSPYHDSTLSMQLRAIRIQGKASRIIPPQRALPTPWRVPHNGSQLHTPV
jgi:hypothetical protein